MFFIVFDVFNVVFVVVGGVSLALLMLLLPIRINPLRI